MKIIQKTTYLFDNREFRDMADTKKHIENQIGDIIHSADVTLMPSQKLAVFYSIVHNKKRLCALLNAVEKYELENQDDDRF